MSSRWFLQSDGESAEPVTFERLAQMLADGSLQDADLVRPEQGGDWQTADSVIGLIRAAWRLRDATLQEPGRAAVPEVASSRLGASGHIEQQAGSLLHLNCANPDSEDDPGHGLPARRSISVTRTVVLSMLLAAIGWFGWFGWFGWLVWNESGRFPVPAHARIQRVPWSLPLLGPVSDFEVGLLAFDAVAVVVFGVWWLRAKKAESNPGNPKCGADSKSE